MKNFRKFMIIFILATFSAITVFSQHPNNDPKPMEFDRPSEQDLLKMNESVQNGHVLMKEGKYKEAIKEFETAAGIMPMVLIFPYEIAHCYYQMADYKEAINRLSPLKSHPETLDRVFQLLGNSYRHLKQAENAVSAYNEGLNRFPNSGRLYMELGVTEFMMERFKNAADYWERGIVADPLFERNYYHLSDYYSETTEKLWTVLYGEIFINMTSDDERLFKQKKLILNTYKNALYDQKDNRVNFTSIHIKTQDKKNRMPFAMAFEEIMTDASKDLLPKNKDDFSIEILTKIRKKFIEIWFNDAYNERFPNPLFDFQKKVINDGFFEPYNIMIFTDFNSDDYKNWVKDNSKSLRDYFEWIKVNRQFFDKENYFSRRKFE